MAAQKSNKSAATKPAATPVAKGNRVIGKSDAFLVRGTSSKTKTVYTVGFSSEAIAVQSIPFFKLNGVQALSPKPVKTAKGWEIRYEAIEQSLIRTALRLFKSAGIAVYRGDTPTYLKKASDAGLALAQKLQAKAQVVEDLAKAVIESKETK